MLYFILAVAFTVGLYLLMRSFPKWGVNVLHAVIFNYVACVILGILLTPDFTQAITAVDWGSTGTHFTLALGALFILVFLLIGKSTQKSGVTAASLAGNLSLVIPVLFGLFVFHNAHKEFTPLNFTGLALTIPALTLASLNPGSSTSFRLQGIIWPVLYFIASGTNNTLINYLTSHYYEPGSNSLFMVLACCGAVFIGMIVLLAGSLKSGEWPSFKSIAAGLFLGIPNFLSLYFLLKALADYGNSAAFVFPVYNILTILASSATAFWIFHEKLSKTNAIGLILAVIAIVLISYQELAF
ncbi:hypothetical protein GCM10023091_01410 [Ravibacter arvi]|uniref:EamA domain-containing protein n=1 Tax=Ravibacter arvi TaxID=2051041 RepID=A0ABP8LK46_9BACT